MIPGTTEAIELLATIQQEQFQKQAKCGRVSFTPFGKCIKCEYSENCHRLEWIFNRGE